MVIIDTCGLSCPQPVLMVLKCIKDDKPNALEVLVDNDASRENVPRDAQNNGFAVEEKAEGQETRLVLPQTD